MTNEVYELDVVESGSILFVHGVGLDPRLFEPTMLMMSQPSSAPLRPPYRTAAVAPTESMNCAEYVNSQADALLDRLVNAHDVTLVGVSGGATIVLAAATRRHDGLAAVAGVIAHEPLIGPLAVDLHEAVAASAHTLADDAADEAAADFVHRLVGSTWSSIPAEHTNFALHHAAVVRSEVPGFAAYAPTLDDLASTRLPLTITTGGLSHQRRHRAAQVIAEASGASSFVIAGAGHLVHWEQPAEFASVIAEEQQRWIAAA